MAIRGLNHLTLAVADLDRSVPFYRDVLGLRLAARWRTGAYLEAGTLWLCLSLARLRPHPDYTHAAFDVAEEDFEAAAARIRAVSLLWRENRSEGPSLYFHDPDGHRLDLHAGSLRTRLDAYRASPPDGLVIEDQRQE